MYREKWVEDWETLAQVCAHSGGPEFAPVVEETIAALCARFDLPDYFEELLRIGYPVSPVRLGCMALFPSISDLLEFGRDDPKWPRAWVPIDISDGHIVYLVRRDADGVFRQSTEYLDGYPDQPDSGTDWVSFQALLYAALVLYSEIGNDGIASAGAMDGDARAGEWLRPHVVSRIVARLGVFETDTALDFFHLTNTAADVYQQARTNAIVASIGAVLFAVPAVGLIVLAITNLPDGFWQWVIVLGGTALFTGMAAKCGRYLMTAIRQMKASRAQDEQHSLWRKK